MASIVEECDQALVRTKDVVICELNNVPSLSMCQRCETRFRARVPDSRIELVVGTRKAEDAIKRGLTAGQRSTAKSLILLFALARDTRCCAPR